MLPNVCVADLFMVSTLNYIVVGCIMNKGL